MPDNAKIMITIFNYINIQQTTYILCSKPPRQETLSKNPSKN